MRVALIACGKSKASSPKPAAEMYLSQLFRSSLRYARATCDRFFILSAKHGLLASKTVIEPYDLALADLTEAARAEWGLRIAAQLDAALPHHRFHSAELVVLAGELYADAFDSDRDWFWEEPLRGLGIGRRLSWLKQNTPEVAA